MQKFQTINWKGSGTHDVTPSSQRHGLRVCVPEIHTVQTLIPSETVLGGGVFG